MNFKLFWLSVLVFSSGCINDALQGISIGNAMQMGLTPDEGSGYMTQDASGAEFTIDQASAQVDRIGFDIPSLIKCEQLGLSSPVSCDESTGGAQITGDYTADLVTAAFDPAIDDLTMPSTKFDTMDVTVNTLNVMGSFPYNNETLTYAIEVSFAENIPFDTEDGFKLEDNQTLWMTLNTTDWLADVGMVQCLDSGILVPEDGHVVVNNDCDNALDQVSGAIRNSASLSAK